MLNVTGLWDGAALLSTPNFNAGRQGEESLQPGDKGILRELAEKLAGQAALPEQQQKRELWRRHNDLEATRPLVFCDPENGWNEIDRRGRACLPRHPGPALGDGAAQRDLLGGADGGRQSRSSRSSTSATPAAGRLGLPGEPRGAGLAVLRLGSGHQGGGRHREAARPALQIDQESDSGHRGGMPAKSSETSCKFA